MNLLPYSCSLSASPSAWLHNPALSLWLSVDPLSDKYPGVSPYVYCANNPVRLVDVDGREIWEFDENGQFIKSISYEYDIIRIINSETGSSIVSAEYAKGTILELEPGTCVNLKDLTSQSANLFQVNSSETAKGIFEFVSDNTNVEWGIVADASKDGVSVNFIGTDCKPTSNSVVSMIDKRGYDLSQAWCAHSHPVQRGICERLPSQSDHNHAKTLE